jgi:AraC-like DNA-binding protein
MVEAHDAAASGRLAAVEGHSMDRSSPAPPLASVIGGYCGYEERSPAPVRRREVPSGAIPMIISFEDRIDVSTAGAPAAAHTSFVAGLHDAYTVTEHGGRQRGIQIDLTPLGAYRLFGVPMDEMANRVVPLDGLQGRPFDSLVDQLASAADWPATFAILDRTLSGWLADGPSADPAVAWAWRQLQQSHGLVPVSVLAEEIGWSRRHFISRFRQQIGLAPKATARVLRFSRAVSLLGCGPIAAVAAACGYADHSHLVREFQDLAGCTPTELLATRTMEAGYPAAV